MKTLRDMLAAVTVGLVLFLIIGAISVAVIAYCGVKLN